MSMYDDTVDVTPEGVSEGAALSGMFGESAPVETERGIETITEEIIFYKNVGGQAVIEIGRRLTEAKAQLKHGEWLPWLKSVGISASTAANYMRIAKEISPDSRIAQLPYTKILALMAAPAEDREALADAAESMSAAEIRRLTEERNKAAEAANAESTRADAAEEAEALGLLGENLGEIRIFKISRIVGREAECVHIIAGGAGVDDDRAVRSSADRPGCAIDLFSRHIVDESRIRYARFWRFVIARPADDEADSGWIVAFHMVAVDVPHTIAIFFYLKFEFVWVLVEDIKILLII